MVTWLESYNIGIQRIDEQHKQLISIINTLCESMKQGKGNEILGSILQELIDFARFHFKLEEDYFDQFNYEGKDYHKVQHANFIKKIFEFQEQIEQGNTRFCIELMRYLQEWIDIHILGSDRRYVECFKEHGL